MSGWGASILDAIDVASNALGLEHDGEIDSMRSIIEYDLWETSYSKLEGCTIFPGGHIFRDSLEELGYIVETTRRFQFFVCQSLTQADVLKVLELYSLSPAAVDRHKMTWFIRFKVFEDGTSLHGAYQCSFGRFDGLWERMQSGSWSILHVNIEASPIQPRLSNSRANVLPSDVCDEDFMSTRSILSKTTFYTAPVGASEAHSTAIQSRLETNNTYARLLESKKLWPVNPQIEQDWSGRGQHAEFQKHERKLINDILEVHDTLGSTKTAIVQSVKCRRILLARKTIICSRYFTKDQAIEEVAHLTRLDHSHILRVIGTYVVGRELSILMYPVADHDLETFLDDINNGSDVDLWKLYSIDQFFLCLSNALYHIHGNGIKHMDIKPTNILVRRIRLMYKVYIADFGIARAYCNPDDAETDGPTSFTRKYAAPEVCSYQETGVSRGFPADIFSMGCVFTKLIATIWDFFVAGRENENIVQKLSMAIHKDGTDSYQANIDAVLKVMEICYNSPPSFIPHPYVGLALIVISDMMNKHPKSRPRARELARHFGENLCCEGGRDELEAMSPEIPG